MRCLNLSQLNFMYSFQLLFRGPHGDSQEACFRSLREQTEAWDSRCDQRESHFCLCIVLGPDGIQQVFFASQGSVEASEAHDCDGDETRDVRKTSSAYLMMANLRQTDPEADQHPELHTSLHRQAPEKFHRVCGNRKVDKHTESLDCYSAVQLWLFISGETRSSLRAMATYCARALSPRLRYLSTKTNK